MNKVIVELGEIKVVGSSVRTTYAAEMDPETACIGTLWYQYISQGLAQHISHRKNPGVTWGIYTEYGSDWMGEYTCFVREEVVQFEAKDTHDFKNMVIPAQKYMKFTSDPGPMPQTCIALWQKIWQMSEEELGGERSYIADFEIYDERSLDPQSAVLDIYIGIK